MPPVLVFVVVGFIAVALVLGYMATEKRRKLLRAWAAGRGLSFQADRDGRLDNQFPEFKCLHQGSSRFGYNRIAGDWHGRRMLAFDYHYVTGSGKNRQTHTFSAVILHSDVPLKPLLIRPEGFFDKVAEFFGCDDLDFESAEFSRKFFVKSPDRKWAYDVIHPQTIEFLLSAPRFTIQLDRPCVIAYKSSCFRPDDFEAAAEIIRGILDRLPEYLRRQQREGAPE